MGRRAIVLDAGSVPMFDFYVLSSESKEFDEGNLILGHVTASSAETAATAYDGLYDDCRTWRAVIPAEQIVWCRMEELDDG